MRIAPIQVTNYGHPVSTFGAKIDYWIGGQETEVAALAREHYSERLVLIPGCGQAPVPLEYGLEYPRLPDAPITVNCTWSGQKINSDHVRRLKTIADRVKTPVRFHFFPGGAVLGRERRRDAGCHNNLQGHPDYDHQKPGCAGLGHERRRADIEMKDAI